MMPRSVVDAGALLAFADAAVEPANFQEKAKLCHSANIPFVFPFFV
jgi:hypothetical protein